MVLPIVLGMLALARQDPSADLGIILLDPVTHAEAEVIRQPQDRLNPPKLSPKKLGVDQKRLRFDWLTSVAGYLPRDEQGTQILYTKVRIYSQERNGEVDPAIKIARLLARLWDYKFHVLNWDQPSAFHDGTVDVYLCDTGRPGGEQLYDYDDQIGGNPKVNTIYIYDLPSFTDPMEMAREVAHEYGHATLAQVGGYTEPEDWANGFLGEKLYLRHVLQEYDAGHFDLKDAMGVSPDKLRAWVHANVDPLVIAAAERGPSIPALKDRSSKGMDAYIGLALYMDTILPEELFAKSQEEQPTADAKDYLDTVVTYSAEQAVSPYSLKIPDYLKGRKIWIPLGNCKLSGAEVVQHPGDWVQIVAGSKPVTITPQH